MSVSLNETSAVRGFECSPDLTIVFPIESSKLRLTVYFEVASNTVKTWKDGINKQQDEQNSLARNISTLNDDLKSIGRGGRTLS